jgi:threonine dehydratase
MTPSLSIIYEAQKFLAAHLPLTPLTPCPALNRADAQLHLKLELELPTASFKPRGALYALSVNLRRRTIEEVTASSTGNHGAAVAFAAKTLGVRATIFLPANPNPVKRQRIADLGAQIIEVGGPDLAAASVEAQEYSRRPGIYFLNDATDRDLPAGPATIGLEILRQLPQVAAIYVPMGDTALIRGLAAGVKQRNARIHIIGVQAERAPSYYLSWKENRPRPTDTCDTIADGLATRTPEPENVHAIHKLVDDIILVSENEMLAAIGLLHQHAQAVAEPSGAAATAAFLKQPFARGPVAALVTGGNLSDAIRLRAGLPQS